MSSGDKVMLKIVVLGMSFVLMAGVCMYECIETGFYVLVVFSLLLATNVIINRVDLLSPIVAFTVVYWVVFGIGSINFEFYPPIFFGIKEVPDYLWYYYLIGYVSVATPYVHGHKAAAKQISFWQKKEKLVWGSKEFWRAMNLFLFIGMSFSLAFFALQGDIPIFAADPDSARRIVEWRGAGFVFFNTYFIDFIPIFVVVYLFSNKSTMSRKEQHRCILYICMTVGIRLLFAVRGQLIPVFLTSLLAYHIYIKRVCWKNVVIFGACILMFFGAVGYIRDLRQNYQLSKVLSDSMVLNTLITSGLAIRQIPVSLTYILENVPGHYDYLRMHGIVRPFLSLLPGYGNVVVQEDAEFWGVDEQMGVTGSSIGQAYRIWGIWFVIVVFAIWGYYMAYFYDYIKNSLQPFHFIIYALLFSIFIVSTRSGLYVFWPEVLWKFVIVYGMHRCIHSNKHFSPIGIFCMLIFWSGICFGYIAVLRNI